MPETTLASPSLRRLTRTGKPDWERYLDTLEYNMPAWNASNWIVKHNIKIIGHVKHIHDYETAFGTTRVLILLLKKCADNLGRLPHEQQLACSLEALRSAHDAIHAELLSQVRFLGSLNPDMTYFE